MIGAQVLRLFFILAASSIIGLPSPTAALARSPDFSQFDSVAPGSLHFHADYLDRLESNFQKIMNRVQERSEHDLLFAEMLKSGFLKKSDLDRLGTQRGDNGHFVIEFESIFELNRKAWELWGKILACSDHSYAKARRNYSQGTYCLDPSSQEALKADFSNFQISVYAFLLSTRLEAKSLSEIYSRKLGGDENDLVVFMHPFFVQKILENLSSLRIYFWLDTDTSSGSRFLSFLKNPRYPKSALANANEAIINKELSDPQKRLVLDNGMKLLSFIEKADCAHWGLWPHASIGILTGIERNLWTVGIYGSDKLFQGLSEEKPQDYLNGLRWGAMEKCSSVLPKSLGISPKYPGAYTKMENRAWWNDALRLFRKLYEQTSDPSQKQH